MSRQAGRRDLDGKLLDDLDEKFVDLFGLLNRKADSSTIEPLANGIMDEQRGKLVYADHQESGRGWRDNYPVSGFAWGRIEQLKGVDAQTKKSLRALFDALAAVACGGADTPRQKLENARRLQDALVDYGYRRELAMEGDGVHAKGTKRKGKRGRKPGGKRWRDDTRLFRDWKAAHGISRITKAEFIRERGMPPTAFAALERGRANLKRKRASGLNRLDEPRQDGSN